MAKLSKTFRRHSGEARTGLPATVTAVPAENAAGLQATAQRLDATGSRPAESEMTAGEALWQAEAAAKRGDISAVMRWRQVIEYKYGGLVNAARLARKQKPAE